MGKGILLLLSHFTHVKFKYYEISDESNNLFMAFETVVMDVEDEV